MADPCSDHDAIRNLLARYTYNGDRGRISELAACFASDGILEFPGGKGQGPEGVMASLTTGPDNPARTFVRHHTTNPLIEVTGDNATVRSYFTVISNNGPDHAGTYDDRLVRVSDGWRFAHRRVRIDWQSEVSVFGRMSTRKDSI